MVTKILNLLIIPLVISEVSRCFRQKLSSAKFQNFVSCLSDQGLVERSVAPRGESVEYKTLNFQEQKYPGQILPLAFALPENEDDVLKIVLCGLNNSIRVVPKSGGHSAEKFSYGDSDSVVVDLRKLNLVEVDRLKEIASVGSGSLLGPLLHSLWTEGGYFIPTGSCPTVGIGGHATGGGHGFLGRTYGLALDHILEIRIVTADGVLRTVNSGQNPDLFWALRGAGGGSFGIITSFLFKIQPAPPTVRVGTLKFTLSQFPQVFLAWQQFTLHGSRNLSGEFNIFPDRGLEIYFFDPTGVEGNLERIQKSFPPTNSTGITSYAFPDFLYYESYNFSGEFREKRRRREAPSTQNEPNLYPPGKSFFVQKTLDSNSTAFLYGLFIALPQTTTVRFESYGGAIGDVGEGDTAFVHRKGRLANAVVNLEPGANSNLNLRGVEWMKSFFEVGKSLWGQHETYQNYVDRELPNYLERYYGGNLLRLIQIKRKYDPRNYFHHPQSIPTQI